MNEFDVHHDTLTLDQVEQQKNQSIYSFLSELTAKIYQFIPTERSLPPSLENVMGSMAVAANFQIDDATAAMSIMDALSKLGVTAKEVVELCRFNEPQDFLTKGGWKIFLSLYNQGLFEVSSADSKEFVPDYLQKTTRSIIQ